MKKFLLILIFAFAPMIAIAGGPNGPGEQFYNNFSGCVWYGGTGSGMVHERFACNADWDSCQGNWTWFPVTKWPDGPDSCDGDGPFYFGPLGDVGDGSDILVPGEYYICIKSMVFRDKGNYEFCPFEE